MEAARNTIMDLNEVILNGIPEPIILIDTHRKIVWANKTAGQLTEIVPAKLIGRACSEVFNGGSEVCPGCPLAEVLDTKAPNESEFTSPDGRIWSIHTYPVLDDGGAVRGIIETRRDTTSKRIIDESIKETKEHFRLLAESAHDLIFRYRFSPTKGFDYVSPSSAHITGYAPEEFYARRDLFFDIVHPEDRPRVKKSFETPASRMPAVDFRVTRKDGTVLALELQLAQKHDADKKTLSIHGIGRDITEWKRNKERQRLVVEILEVLNQVGEKKDRIMLILLLIKDYTGVDAVGIRLKQGDDFPYYETRGFDSSFIEAERYICARDGSGEILRGSRGEPSLECLCGSVISGKIDHTLPTYTKNGSFWINGKPDAATLAKMKSIPGLRGTCFEDGYESVALIPLRSGDETVGLLQLNDTRKNMFTPEMIGFYEGIAVSVGIAFKRNMIEEEKERLIGQLKQSLKKATAL